MTTQSGKQERGNRIRDIVHCTRRPVDRLALSKGERESEGFLRRTEYRDSTPVTSVLSPCTTGEAEEIAMEQH
jgi:hypothetical protein